MTLTTQKARKRPQLLINFSRDLLFNGISIVSVIFFALPVLYLVFGAFLSRAEVTTGAFFPARIQWENFRIALIDSRMLFYFRNSLLYTITIVLLNIFFCSLVGFALAKFNFPGRNILFILVLVHMMIPGIVLIVPLYLEVKNLGLLYTPLAMILPVFVDSFGIFLMRQYIMGISDEYLDAARVEGCSEFGIFLRIILPLSTPAIGALMLYRFVAIWNDYFWPLLVTNEKGRTLPVAINQFASQHFAAPELQLTTSFIGALPIFVVLIFFTKQVFNATVARTGGMK